MMIKKNKIKQQFINKPTAMYHTIFELEKSETELKHEKERPRESEEKYHALLENASDGGEVINRFSTGFGQ